MNSAQHQRTALSSPRSVVAPGSQLSFELCSTRSASSYVRVDSAGNAETKTVPDCHRLDRACRLTSIHGCTGRGSIAKQSELNKMLREPLARKHYCWTIVGSTSPYFPISQLPVQEVGDQTVSGNAVIESAFRQNRQICERSYIQWILFRRLS
ncbi:hypothetical protein BVRB_026810 [Beta vulgaris subsp. vulgaris]|uniref:Uncharacterized protein n=1 Tax=Beta vulgaris subsp. vulgaris TaxID=3555 RepID=A0A0J8B1X2_BETVV|nr:hypothetical protein BVRB_026810 [Beta vulgaris subsp. vulgaris]